VVSRTLMYAVAYIQRNSGQVGWPNSAGWVHKESPGETSETVSNKVGRKSDEN